MPQIREAPHVTRKTLRPHQAEAVEAAVAALGGPDTPVPPSGEGAARSGRRASVVSACGTGKTVVGVRTAARLAPRGRVLVLVPTLDLLTQTALEWRADGRAGAAIAVCSIERDEALTRAEVRRTTTSPTQLALWASQLSQLTVFGTYTSLDVIEEAHLGPHGLTPLAPWDLVVVDEAHRTSGHIGKPWAMVHDNTRIPAHRRLYLTATPRVWEAPGDQVPVRRTAPPARVAHPGAAPRTAEPPPETAGFTRLPERLAASMDDEAVFGKRVYELPLAEAIDRGLLAAYQIIVLEIRDRAAWDARIAADNNPEDAGLAEAARGTRLAALQTALLKACAEHDLKTVLTFHYRTAEADAFATSLPHVARRLHAGEPGACPREVASAWVYGEHLPEERREIFARFAAGTTAEGTPADLSVLANSKVVAEGVDIPAVDAVAFCDPKGSIVDIVQAVGRALRQAPHQGKRASLLVPAFLDPDDARTDAGAVRLEAELGAADDPDRLVEAELADRDDLDALRGQVARRQERERGVRELFALSAYEPLAVVLQALRAHDSDVVDRLAVPQVSGATAAREFGLAYEEVAYGDEESPWSRAPLLRFASPRDPAEIAEFVRLRVIAPETTLWLRGLAAAKHFRAREGHLRVPLDHWEGAFPLGKWVSEQRRVYFADALDARRVHALDEYGMVWRVPDAQFAEGLAMAAAWARTHGHLAAPADAAVDGYLVGQWLKNQRRPGALDKHPDRRDQLAAIDPWWNPPWPIDWQRRYNTVRRRVGAPPESGKAPRLNVRVLELVVGGEDLAAWLRRQVAHWAELHKDQRRLLGELGVPRPRRPRAAAEPATSGPPAEPPAARRRGHADKFAAGLAAAAQFRSREGHLEVPRKQAETVAEGPYEGETVALGVWIANQRTRAGALTAERRDALSALGMRW